jgi:hypothetical protein
MLMSLGIGLTLGGAVSLALGPSLAPPPSTDPTLNSINQSQKNLAQSMTVAGGVMLGLGVPMTVVGIVLMVKSRTHVTMDGQSLALKLPGTRLALSPTGLHF